MCLICLSIILSHVYAAVWQFPTTSYSDTRQAGRQAGSGAPWGEVGEGWSDDMGYSGHLRRYIARQNTLQQVRYDEEKGGGE